ncbi:tetratricopeptide repeat-containing protein [Fusobacterium nucleatum]|uniref:tetratricopeptide repeat-containing protein n=1 Tax=Fusobacterium nucleatum TaxID=851 RepID=UPI0030D048ED
MDKKICFVVMGFGKKMDYRNSKEVDLDIIYEKVIKNLFSTLSKYKLIRADEISGSDIIDVNMYSLLLSADLVIADITTMNENALYELGIRHALKPFSTIIMMQESEKIPFDINHCRILKYKDFGEQLDDSEAETIKNSLHLFIKESEKQKTDSPLYTYLPNIVPPSIPNNELKKLINQFENNEETISCILLKAKELNKESKFKESVSEWIKLRELLPNNEYVIQQLALAKYKSHSPNKTMALQEALNIINILNPKNSLDLETLGITGAIYKNLFKMNNNYDYLDEAIMYYKKGFIIKKDYYNGENYSNCLLLKTQKSGLEEDEVNYLKFESKSVCREIITIIENDLKKGEINYWMYATLATCYLCLKDEKNHQKYETEFFANTAIEWEIETYKNTIADTKKILMIE